MRLLVTVLSSAEAKQIADLADMLDVKDPSKGPLGAPDHVVVHSVRSAIGSQSPLAVSLGEVGEDVSSTVELARLFAGAGATMLKVGLSDISQEAAQANLAALRASISANVQVVAVAYADYEERNFFPPFSLPGVASEAGLSGIMLDTFDKDSNKSLFGFMEAGFIRAIIMDAKGNKMITGLAGKLDMEDIDTAAASGADWIGFRSAIASEGAREKIGVDRSKLNKLKMRLRLASKKVR